jgi:hypothetical protein
LFYCKTKSGPDIPYGAGDNNFAGDNKYVSHGREQELLKRIRELEEQNSMLQDKLDMIWAVLAPDYDEPNQDDAEEEDSEPPGPRLVQIDSSGGKKSDS